MPTLLSSFTLFPLPASIEYLGHIENPANDSLTGDFDIGEANGGKEIFVVASVTYSSVRTFSSATIAGASATLFTTDFPSTSARQVGCFVSLPTQAGSQTITLAFSGTLGSGAMFVFKVLNRAGIGTNHSDAGDDSGDNYSGGTNTSITLDQTTIPDSGIWLTTGTKNNLDTNTWNNGTLTDEVNSTTIIGNQHWCAHRLVSSGSTPSDVFSWAGDNFCSGASWAFAG